MIRLLHDPKVVLTALCGIFLVLSFFGLHPWLPYLSVLFGSYFALKSAWESLVERSIDVNFLMVIAAIGAVLVGQPLDAAALLFLFSLSSTLESLAMARTRSAIEGLVRLRPDTAVLLTEGGEAVVKVEQLKLEDKIKIPPFEAIPVDAIVEAGESSVDQGAMTGESVPVSKAVGDRLMAGTRNLDNALIARVVSTVGDSTLDKIVALVQDAQENKASGERISAWFGQKYTFFVLGVFAVALCGRILFGESVQAAMYASLTLLVALSPCALVISVPATTLSALAWSARNGILVRGGEFIEKAGRIDIVALDKTGTLTLGRPRLVEICVCAKSLVGVGSSSGSCTEEEACWHGDGPINEDGKRLLRFAAAAEAYSAHPVAHAILESARQNEMTVPVANSQSSAPGLGVMAEVEGKQVAVGQLEYIRESGIDVPEAFAEHIGHFQEAGMSVALVSVDGELAALGFRDQPRPEAGTFLSDVKAAGAKRVVMLSGDTKRTVDAIASGLGIDERHSQLMPADKAQAIQEWTTAGEQVMMVGDGINDAPPLAAATLGVAMGGLGSDIAMNAADVVLMHDRLDRIPQLMRLGQRTNRVIRANLFFATGVIAILTVFSLLGHLPLPIAVLGHEGSTVLVILNGLRVLRGP